MPSRKFFCVVETRIMKNSSRFVAGDGEELHPLEERMRRVERLVEDALVEFQPAQLAVDVERRILEVSRIKLRQRLTIRRAGRGRRLDAVAVCRAAVRPRRYHGRHP